MFERMKMEGVESIYSKWKTNQYLSFEMALKIDPSTKGGWGSVTLEYLNRGIIATERTAYTQKF